MMEDTDGWGTNLLSSLGERGERDLPRERDVGVQDIRWCYLKT